MIAGTPAYLAPEVAIGGDPGPESDVFSLGSTLYAACEGQPPFGLPRWTLKTVVPWGHLVMQRKQLLGIARRAERGARVAVGVEGQGSRVGA